MFYNVVIFCFEGRKESGPGRRVRALFLSLVVPSVLPTNLSKELKCWSGTVPARKIPFYGIQIPFLELMYRSAELSKNPLFFKNLSWECSGEPIQENQNLSRNHPTNSYVVTETVPGTYLENQY